MILRIMIELNYEALILKVKVKIKVKFDIWTFKCMKYKV